MVFLIFILVFVIIAALTYLWLDNTKAQIKGQKGEQKIAHILKHLPEDKYIVLNDILLKTQFGTTQIDHIIISVYGIFVIETKNYSGWIMGSEHGEQWTKNIYGNKYLFRNPLKQNLAHIKALQGILKIPKNKFISIIVFSEKSTIKVNTSEHVIYSRDLMRTITEYNTIKFSNHDLNHFMQVIQNHNSLLHDDRIEHINQIKKRIQYNKSQIQN